MYGNELNFLLWFPFSVFVTYTQLSDHSLQMFMDYCSNLCLTTKTTLLHFSYKWRLLYKNTKNSITQDLKLCFQSTPTCLKINSNCVHLQDVLQHLRIRVVAIVMIRCDLCIKINMIIIHKGKCGDWNQ